MKAYGGVETQFHSFVTPNFTSWLLKTLPVHVMRRMGECRTVPLICNFSFTSQLLKTLPVHVMRRMGSGDTVQLIRNLSFKPLPLYCRCTCPRYPMSGSRAALDFLPLSGIEHRTLQHSIGVNRTIGINWIGARTSGCPDLLLEDSRKTAGVLPRSPRSLVCFGRMLLALQAVSVS
jgi:hypothetical protein